MKMTQQIPVKCNLLDQAIRLFSVARNALDGSYGKYEANSEALNLLNLTIRHIEGVITLARTNLLLLSPAEVAARAAFEGSIRAAWLVQPGDPFDREPRWLAHLAGEEEYLRRQLRDLGLLGADGSELQGRLTTLTAFRRDAGSLIAERGYATDSAIPNFRECLRLLGEERMYLLYSLLSQTAHATHSVTWRYRSGGLGTQKVEGEFIEADQWDLPLNICRFVRSERQQRSSSPASVRTPPG